MSKVGIIGANGQVGAELCLLLAGRPGIDLVPICRNRSGSAFLRWKGIACRHGRAADAADAPRLLGDCDVIVNSSLASGTPAEIRRIENRVIQNAFAHSKASATFIHFSTQSVYGDPRPGQWIRWRSPYGRVKLATERHVRIQQRLHHKSAFILRLGHVCGALQEITNSIRNSIRNNTVILPSRDDSSNTVHTGAIIQAIEQIMRGAAEPGTYDLMNTPLWSWREVYQYEAGACGVQFRPLVAEVPLPPSWQVRISRFIIQVASGFASAQPVRDLVAKSFAHVPDDVNARAMAWWYAKRARSEIAALNSAPAPAEHLSWVSNGLHLFPAEKPTVELLPRIQALQMEGTCAAPWPADLPDATCHPAGVQRPAEAR